MLQASKWTPPLLSAIPLHPLLVRGRTCLSLRRPSMACVTQSDGRTKSASTTKAVSVASCASDARILPPLPSRTPGRRMCSTCTRPSAKASVRDRERTGSNRFRVAHHDSRVGVCAPCRLGRGGVCFRNTRLHRQFDFTLKDSASLPPQKRPPKRQPPVMVKTTCKSPHSRAASVGHAWVRVDKKTKRERDG